MLGLKGVLVDFGWTVAYVDHDDDRKYAEGIASILKNYGHQNTLGEVMPILYAAYRSTTKGEVKTLYDFWKLFLGKLGIPENPELIRELRELQERHASTMFGLYSGTGQVLSALKRKYRLALVSNCAIGLSDVVEALGLTRFFDAVVLSYEVGVRKPDSRIYLEALRKLKLRPEDCAFVSDEISDLEGARKVGLKTVLVRQGNRTMHEAKDPNFKPDRQCNRISDIAKLLL